MRDASKLLKRMTSSDFENVLKALCAKLTQEARQQKFSNAAAFERRVREEAQSRLAPLGIAVELTPPAQQFPDIAAGAFGIEVKFTVADTWRSVANSVLETNRVASVKQIYVVFGNMGAQPPEVRWRAYADSVVHVRTSHVPRFEVDVSTSAASLFATMGVSYDVFRGLPMHQKMEHVRKYAKKRLKPGERLWWLSDESTEAHTLPLEVKLYTSLSDDQKTQLRAEAVLLSPKVVAPSRTRGKYDDVVLYLLTYHGVLAHQTRDMFTAGSVSDPNHKRPDGLYIIESLKLLESAMREAARRLPMSVIEEYWGKTVAPQARISEWLKRADEHAGTWTPSKVLFRNKS